MIELPPQFITRMKSMLEESFEAFIESYNLPPEKAVRVNTLKTDVENFKKISPFELEPVPWEPNGFYTRSAGLGKTLYHAAGLYYVQEPSAMCAAPKLEVKSGERVLDLCSAPGGKGTQLAQSMNGGGIIVLNEINFSRAKILSSNVERLGIKNAVVTCAAPSKLASCFKEYFDKILVDAPCSGEGMFKKEEAAIPEWSEENVKSCAARQEGILQCAYEMLAAGGRLVYSTCTFSTEEDEGQIERFLSAHSDCRLLEMEKLYPHEIRGEGHFYAVITKAGGNRLDKPLIAPKFKDGKLSAVYRDWEKDFLNVKFGNLHLIDKTLYSLPDGTPSLNVQTLRAGIRLGEFSGDRFEPSHSLAMCLKAGEAAGIEVDEATALNYLKGLTFDCPDNIKGWRLVLYNSFPLGWCKVSGGTAKNKLPKGLRI